jgi:hypothetical protein
MVQEELEAVVPGIGRGSSMFFSPGACPICGPTFPLGFVRSLDDNNILIFCHSCETAWADPSGPETNVTFNDHVVLAPDGMTLATKEEVHRAGFADAIRAEYPDEWDYIFYSCKHIHKPQEER